MTQLKTNHRETRPYLSQYSKHFAQSLAIMKERAERTTGQITAAGLELIKRMQPVLGESPLAIKPNHEEDG